MIELRHYVRVSLALALAATASGCAGATAARAVPVSTPLLEAPPVEIDTADLPVYAAAITALFSGDRALRDTLGLIDRTTSPDKFAERFPEMAAQIRAARASSLRGLRPETAEDFDAKALSPALLRTLVPTRLPHRLVPHGSDDARAWFPDSSFVRPRTAVSRVGYSADRTQALVYVELHCPLCGWGELVLLEYRIGAWEVTARLNVWNS